MPEPSREKWGRFAKYPIALGSSLPGDKEQFFNSRLLRSAANFFKRANSKHIRRSSETWQFAQRLHARVFLFQTDRGTRALLLLVLLLHLLPPLKFRSLALARIDCVVLLLLLLSLLRPDIRATQHKALFSLSHPETLASPCFPTEKRLEKRRTWYRVTTGRWKQEEGPGMMIKRRQELHMS